MRLIWTISKAHRCLASLRSMSTCILEKGMAPHKGCINMCRQYNIRPLRMCACSAGTEQSLTLPPLIGTFTAFPNLNREDERGNKQLLTTTCGIYLRTQSGLTKKPNSAMRKPSTAKDFVNRLESHCLMHHSGATTTRYLALQEGHATLNA